MWTSQSLWHEKNSSGNTDTTGVLWYKTFSWYFQLPFHEEMEYYDIKLFLGSFREDYLINCCVTNKFTLATCTLIVHVYFSKSNNTTLSNSKLNLSSSWSSFYVPSQLDLDSWITYNVPQIQTFHLNSDWMMNYDVWLIFHVVPELYFLYHFCSQTIFCHLLIWLLNSSFI